MPGGEARAGRVDVVLEIPAGGCNKYEDDDATGDFRLVRVLYVSIHYPTEYGFIPNTRAPDGDHREALVVVRVPGGIAP